MNTAAVDTVRARRFVDQLFALVELERSGDRAAFAIAGRKLSNEIESLIGEYGLEAVLRALIRAAIEYMAKGVRI